MKRMLSTVCALILLLSSLPLAHGEEAAPVLQVENGALLVTYAASPAQEEKGLVYILFNEAEKVALVELNAGAVWYPDWHEDGLYQVQVYFVDDQGATQSRASEWTNICLNPEPVVTPEPMVWDDWVDSVNIPNLPSNSRDINTVSVPVQSGTGESGYSRSVTYTYEGTTPCYENHVGRVIQIADNDRHEATKGRAAPGTSSRQVTGLGIGEVYTVLDCRVLIQNGVHWYLIQKDGMECWVASGRCNLMDY